MDDRADDALIIGAKRQPEPVVRAILLSMLLLIAAAAAAEPQWVTRNAQGGQQVHLWFFWSATCPHCLEAKPVVEAMAARYDWLALHSLELSASRENARRYVEMAAALGEEARSVPGFIVCGRMRVGFDSAATTGSELEQLARACLGEADLPAGRDGTLALPLLGSMDLAQFSLPTVTLLLAAMDAFNPCAFFVLLFLLSLLTHERSRRRMLLIGGVFVLCSGLVYFALMAAWLNVFLIAGELRAVTVAAGAIALFMAAVNLKDYRWFKRGITLSIPERARPRLFQRMRGLLQARSRAALVAGTVTLAIAANSYEALCTAGFPMVYTRLLTLQQLPPAGYYAYLALYNVVYVVPLLVIVLTYVRTLGARKLSEAEGRILKLVSGVMMLGLGATLLLAPTALADPLLALGLVLAAVGSGGIAWWHERRAAGPA
jgi:hypothetical protein